MNEEFKVMNGEGEEIQNKLSMFFTKKMAQEEAALNEEEQINHAMDRIDSMHVPHGYPAPEEIDPADDE